MKKLSILTIAITLINVSIMKSQLTCGIFEGASDIGNVKSKGACSYDTKAEKYNLKGSGTNMWFGHDEFFFAWKKVKGDCILHTWVDFVGKGVEAHRKAGLIIRQSLEPGSPYVDIAYHGDGLISMQYRLEKDSLTKEFKCPLTSTSILQIENTDDTVRTKVASKGDPFTKVGELKLPFDTSKPYYIGLFVCAHNPDVTEEAVFSNVRFVAPAKKNFTPYKDYIGSKLEILDIETGLRKIIYESKTPFEAPNWSRDGKFLVINSKGLLYKISVEGGKPELINTDFANSNNNDHGISPDGRELVISHHAADRQAGENSVIYILPIEGGVPRQITANSPSYWHGWSHLTNKLIYTAKRNNQWDIYEISNKGGEEKQLTSNAFLDDGSEYSTDGQFIWFNSNRTGTMQIWKMKSDGSEQTQITFDQYQNWFAHQSPDGQKIIILSYPPEVNSGDHPYYKHVMLRIMNINEMKPMVITHLYGGQGTINVPSWSPDSKKVAFVSNSD